MASNEHSVWGSHGQEAKRGWPGGQRIPWHGEAMGSFLLPCAPPGCPRSREGAWSVQLLGGSRGRLQWRSRLGATGWSRGGWRCCLRFASPLCVATCPVNYCAACCSMWPL